MLLIIEFVNLDVKYCLDWVVLDVRVGGGLVEDTVMSGLGGVGR